MNDVARRSAGRTRVSGMRTVGGCGSGRRPVLSEVDRQRLVPMDERSGERGEPDTG